MHLPYLAEMPDRFEIVALCDLSPEVLAACAARYGVDRTFSSWEEMIEEPLDAVMVLTPVSHSPPAIAAMEAGINVFVEKPMAFSSRECEAMIAASEAADVQLMVGMMKRYDPAYERLVERLPEIDDLRLIRSMTLESPLEPYVEHYPLVKPASGPPPGPDPDAVALAEAVSEEADDVVREAYRVVLLDSVIHEFNMLRGALGEPDEVRYANVESNRLAVDLVFGGVPCRLDWVELPGIARYRQDLFFYGSDLRIEINLPSPFLRNAPTILSLEGGKPGTPDGWRTEEVVAYDEAFRRELEAFSQAIRFGEPPRTPGEDGLRDVRLCEAVVRCHVTGRPVIDPTGP